MKRKNIAIATTLFLLLMVTSIPITATNNEQSLLPSSSDNLEVKIETDQPEYRWLMNPVNITLSLKNNGSEDVELVFPTTQLFDLEINRTQNNRTIFKWSDGKMFLQVITKFTLSPNSSISWTYVWHQRGHLFQHWFYRPVLPGKFVITGIVPTINTTYEATTSVTIRFGIHIFP